MNAIEKARARRLVNLSSAFANHYRSSDRQKLSRRMAKVLNEVWEDL